MYEAKKFDNLYDLRYFLNENGIKPTEIIGIHRIPTSPSTGVYGLLYYVEDSKSEDQNG